MTETLSTEVHRSVTVKATRQRAFDVKVEPFAGGRWYEIGTDGAECDWGAVLAWDAPGRIVLSWHLNGDYEYYPIPHTRARSR